MRNINIEIDEEIIDPYEAFRRWRDGVLLGDNGYIERLNRAGWVVEFGRALRGARHAFSIRHAERDYYVGAVAENDERWLQLIEELELGIWPDMIRGNGEQRRRVLAQRYGAE